VRERFSDGVQGFRPRQTEPSGLNKNGDDGFWLAKLWEF